MRQIYRRSSEEPPRKVSKWTNKTRVMVLAARGLSFRWVKALVVMVDGGGTEEVFEGLE